MFTCSIHSCSLNPEGCLSEFWFGNTVLCREIWQQWTASKVPYTLSATLSDFTVWRHTWRKNWINCAVLTGNSAGLRNVLSSRLLYRELRSLLRESHTYSVQFFVQFFNTVKLHSSPLCVWGPFRQRGHWDRPRSPVLCQKPGLCVITSQFVYLFPNLSKCVLLVFSHISSQLLLFFYDSRSNGPLFTAV